MARHEAHQSEHLLIGQGEQALIQWSRQLTIAGYPARHAVLQEMAEEIRSKRLASINQGGEVLVRYPPIGVN